MIVYSTNPAHRVTSVAHDFLGELQWSQIFRAAAVWFAALIAGSGALIKLGSLAGAGGWWPVVAVLIAATGAAALSAGMTTALARFEKPYAGAGHLRWQLQAELAAPRHPNMEDTGPETHPLDTGPATIEAPIKASQLRNRCDYPECDIEGAR